jgi:uncharacterized protein YecE (DUF72 family)
MATNFEVGFVLPRSCLISEKGSLRLDDALEKNLGWLREVITALEPRVLVIPTPKDITPGKRDQDLLSQFIGYLPEPRPNTLRVWVPGGLWEPEEAAQYAIQHDMLCSPASLDPILMEGQVAYIRLHALANQPSLKESQIERLLARLEASEAKELFVAVQTRAATKDAQRILHALGAESSEPESNFLPAKNPS